MVQSIYTPRGQRPRRISCVVHVSCIYVRAWWDQKGEKLKKGLVFKTFLKGHNGHGDSTEELQLSEPSRFGITLEPLWGHFGYIRVTLGHFRITLGSLWSHFGWIKVDFQKAHISPIDFNDFTKFWSYFGVALGSLWDHFWHMKVTLGALRGHFGVALKGQSGHEDSSKELQLSEPSHFGVTLGILG